jgi:N-ethylmaleimide reductase
MSDLELLTSYPLGPYTLRNRMVMAPMTRSRAVGDAVPNPLAVTYYEQRASAGLIVTEGSQVSPQGAGYPRTPGIYSDEQVEGWRRVTEAVHARGGRIFLQLWHVGRLSLPVFQPDGALPVAPSAVAAEGQARTATGEMVPYGTPRALELDEIPGVVEQYAHGARQALAAGFDGVEIHGANGYLIDQFLRDGTNRRTDVYGGPIESRVRFLLEVTEAVVKVWGADRVGVRLSPLQPSGGIKDSDPMTTFGHAAEALSRFGLAYLHVLAMGSADPATEGHAIARRMRERFGGTFIINGGYGRETAESALESGLADLVAFGVPFLANPDLPERFAEGAPLNEPERNTFYAGEERGYVDYPTRDALRAEATV